MRSALEKPRTLEFGEKSEHSLTQAIRALGPYSLNLLRRERRQKRLALTAIVLSGLSLVSTAKASPPMKYVGVVMDNSRVEDPVLAQQFTDIAKADGFNTINATAPITPGQADVINEGRVCVAASAAQKAGMNFMLTLIPSNRNGRHDWYPTRSYELDKAATAAGAYLWKIFGPVGCARELTEANVIVGNEPNSPTFLSRSSNGAAGTMEAAFTYTRYLARTNAVLHKDAATLGIKLRVYGGGDASNHDSIGFIEDISVAQKQLGIVGPLMDGFASHPYGINSADSPTNVHTAGAVVGIADYDLLNRAVQKYLAPPGRAMPILYGEYGVNSELSTSVKSLYSKPTSPFDNPVSEMTQGLFYRDAFLLASCQKNVLGLFLFHLQDSGKDGWQSGLYYASKDDTPSNTPKLSLPTVSNTLFQAQAGTLPGC